MAEALSINDAVKYGIILVGLAGGYFTIKTSNESMVIAVAKIETSITKTQDQLVEIDRKQLQQGFAVREITTAIGLINKSIDKKTADRWTARDAKYKHQQQDVDREKIKKRVDALEGSRQ